MLGYLGECSCRVPGGVSGLGDYPDTWEYDQAQKRFYFTAPTGVRVFLPPGVEPSSTPADYRSGAGAAAPSTTSGGVGASISDALKSAFAIPGQVLGEAKPITETIQSDPLLGPLAALGLSKAGLKRPQAPAPVSAPWTTGEKLAAVAGVVGLAAVGGYALSRRGRGRR